MTKDEGDRDRRLLRRIFPEERDFYAMLIDLAQDSKAGVDQFLSWLEQDQQDGVETIVQLEEHLDQQRYVMEHELHEAFSTPIDREEIYNLARQMDYIVNYCALTAKQMKAFRVAPNPAIKAMATDLSTAMGHMTQSLSLLKKKDPKADELIINMRSCQRSIEDRYIEAMSELLDSKDVMEIIRKGEVYSNMMENGKNLRTCIDTMHRILVSVL